MSGRTRADSGSAEACAGSAVRRLSGRKAWARLTLVGHRRVGGLPRARAAGPGGGWGETQLRTASAFIPAPSIHASQGQMCFSHSLEAHCLR